MGDGKDQGDEKFTSTVAIDAESGDPDDLDAIRAHAEKLKMPIGDASTLKLSKQDQEAASTQRATPFFGGDGSEPPKLTDEERRALAAENFTGTVDLRPKTAAADVRPAPTPVTTDAKIEVKKEPRKAPRVISARSKTLEVRSEPSPPARALPIRGVKRSSQETRTQARLLAELMTTEDDGLERFRSRRVTSDVDAATLAHARDLLAGLSVLLENSEPEDEKAVRRAWEALYPLIKRRWP